jgi:hypothetical protein
MHATEQIRCPKYSDHGVTWARWLSPEEREIGKAEPDVYEVECPLCGKYEMPVDPIVWELVRLH